MSDALPIEVSFALTTEDVAAHVRLYEEKTRKADTPSYLSYVYAPVALGLVIMLLAGIGGFTSAQFAAALAIALVSYLGGVLCYSHEVRKSYRAQMRRRVADPVLLGARTLTLQADRIVYASDEATASIAYGSLEEAEIVADWLCIWSGAMGGIVVPLRAFGSREAAQTVCAELRRRMAAGNAAPQT